YELAISQRGGWLPAISQLRFLSRQHPLPRRWERALWHDCAARRVLTAIPRARSPVRLGPRKPRCDRKAKSLSSDLTFACCICNTQMLLTFRDQRDDRNVP